jgi:hypothetical protein
MNDLELAKNVLKKNLFSLVIAKNGNLLFKSKLSGIYGLLQAINELQEDLYDSSIADKVVGRAAALLFKHIGVKEVFAVIVSEAGLIVLNEYGVSIEYDKLVPKILDRRGGNICPFEKFSFTINSPSEALKKFKNFTEQIQKK